MGRWSCRGSDGRWGLRSGECRRTGLVGFAGWRRTAGNPCRGTGHGGHGVGGVRAFRGAVWRRCRQFPVGTGDRCSHEFRLACPAPAPGALVTSPRALVTSLRALVTSSGSMGHFWQEHWSLPWGGVVTSGRSSGHVARVAPARPGGVPVVGEGLGRVVAARGIAIRPAGVETGALFETGAARETGRAERRWRGRHRRRSMGHFLRKHGSLLAGALVTCGRSTGHFPWEVWSLPTAALVAVSEELRSIPAAVRGNCGQLGGVVETRGGASRHAGLETGAPHPPIEIGVPVEGSASRAGSWLGS